ncbi:MAG: DUF167 domain-containing protein [Chitinophagales bacterium]|nr:DUF167 domain-containing protein [Hyphomicrobiales bacterium]
MFTLRKTPYQRAENGVVLFVRLTPKSSRDQVESVGGADDQFWVNARVRAVPENGKANEALCALVAEWIGSPPSTISLQAGGKSRAKQVLIAGDANKFAARLDERIAMLNDKNY